MLNFIYQNFADILVSIKWQIKIDRLEAFSEFRLHISKNHYDQLLNQKQQK